MNQFLDFPLHKFRGLYLLITGAAIPNGAARIWRYFIADDLRWVWGIITFAWISILVSEIAGYGYLHHNFIANDSTALIWQLLVFLASWQVMIIAMMLPSSIPMLKLFVKASSNQERSQQALFVFICAYITVWTGFAIALFSLDFGLHQWSWLRQTPWLYSGFTLAVASDFSLVLSNSSACKYVAIPSVF